MTICFEKSELIKTLVGDIAIKENKSLSAIVERLILDSLMPKNRDARWIAEHYLYAGNGGIGRALSALFGNNAAGIDWKPVHDNFLPLVRFASEQENSCRIPLTGKEEELHHTYSQITSVIDRLKFFADKEADAGNKDKEWHYRKEAAWGDTLLEELKTEPRKSKLVHFYQLLLNNWDIFKDWSITYRMLCDLADLEKGWKNNPDTRTELLQIIKSVSDEWAI